MSQLIFKHPTTVSGVATDGYSIATSCFDGCVRLLDVYGALLVPVEKRGSQLNSVALRGSLIASDDDKATYEEGVAITMEGQIVRSSDFLAQTVIICIDRNGRYGVGQDLKCHDRKTGLAWRVTPPTAGFDRWPMGVEEFADGTVCTVDLAGTIALWQNQVLVNRVTVTTEGLNSVDVSQDGRLIVCSDFAMGLHVYKPDLTKLTSAKESTLVHSVRFLPDNRVVYGTHDGRLCIWDGMSQITTTPSPQTPVSSPGKGKKK